MYHLRGTLQTIMTALLIFQYILCYNIIRLKVELLIYCKCIYKVIVIILHYIISTQHRKHKDNQ